MGVDHEPGEELRKEIQDYCKDVTAPHRYPRRIELLPEPPKTTGVRIRRETVRTTG